MPLCWVVILILEVGQNCLKVFQLIFKDYLFQMQGLCQLRIFSYHILNIQKFSFHSADGLFNFFRVHLCQRL